MCTDNRYWHWILVHDELHEGAIPKVVLSRTGFWTSTLVQHEEPGHTVSSRWVITFEEKKLQKKIIDFFWIICYHKIARNIYV